VRVVVVSCRQLQQIPWRLKRRQFPRGYLLVVFLALLLLATAATNGARILGLVDLQPCPALLLVPLEALEVGKLELVIGLTMC
jgi:hypothetical protein